MEDFLILMAIFNPIELEALEINQLCIKKWFQGA